MDKSGQKIDKWTKSGQISVKNKCTKCRQKTDERKTKYRQNINKTSKSGLAKLDKKWKKVDIRSTKTDKVNKMDKKWTVNGQKVEKIWTKVDRQ